MAIDYSFFKNKANQEFGKKSGTNKLTLLLRHV